MIPTSDEGKRAYDLDRAYVFHSWSAQAALEPMVIAGGSGARIWDHDGNEFLDFSTQLVKTSFLIASNVACSVPTVL